jgi:DNA-binding PadR family transcriptional regulator
MLAPMGKRAGVQMPKVKGTAKEYVLSLLREHPDRELQVSDFFEHQSGPRKFTKQSLHNTLLRLLDAKLVVKGSEGRAAWWAIAQPKK